MQRGLRESNRMTKCKLHLNSDREKWQNFKAMAMYTKSYKVSFISSLLVFMSVFYRIR